MEGREGVEKLFRDMGLGDLFVYNFFGQAKILAVCGQAATAALFQCGCVFLHCCFIHTYVETSDVETSNETLRRRPKRH